MNRSGRWLVMMAACLAVPGVCRAQGSVASWFDPRLGRLRPGGEYSFEYDCQRGTDQPGRALSLSRHGSEVLLPIWQDGNQEWSLRGRFNVWDVDSPAVLPKVGGRLPGELWDIGVGATHRRRLENGWIFGADLDVGSPSDKPFHSLDEVAVTALASLLIPVDRQSSWLLYVQYCNDRNFLRHIPVPGVAWSWRPDPNRNWVVGFPFTFARWRPAEKWTLEGAYFFPRTVHARATYDLTTRLKVFGAFDWTNTSFFRAGRRDVEDRLQYYEARLSAGVRAYLNESVYVEASGGLAVDRFFFEGDDYDDRASNRIRVGDGLFAAVRLAVEF